MAVNLGRARRWAGRDGAVERTAAALRARRKVDGAAIISPDGIYRYALSRDWEAFPRRVLFVMLNPSTADASKDDATIRKCIGFATRWGYGALDVVNLYAFRSTKPEALWAASDPTGAENDHWINSMAYGASRIVAAWGSEMRAQGRAREVLDRLAGIGDVHALKVTLGPPWHPLYVPYSADPVVIRARSLAAEVRRG